MKSPQYLEQAFAAICQEMQQTFIKKHHDYGKGNILEIKELGIVFRINEKANRLKNLLITGKVPVNESLEENFIDIGVYAVIALLYRRGWFEKLELKKV